MREEVGRVVAEPVAADGGAGLSSVVVPMKPVRSKKNGSDRTPAQAHSLFWPIDFVAPFVVPWATVGPPLSDAAWLPV